MTIAEPDMQLPLLQIAPRFRIVKNAQARNAYGTIAADIACAALGLHPIPINGNCETCFDAKRGNTYYEIKSVKRKGGKVVIYDWRMEKEQRANVPLLYCIVGHAVKKSDGSNLLETMLENGIELVVLPARSVHELALRQPRQQMKTVSAQGQPHMGYFRKGYKDGYRNVPYAALKEGLSPKVIKAKAYDICFSTIVWLEAASASDPF